MSVATGARFRSVSFTPTARMAPNITSTPWPFSWRQAWRYDSEETERNGAACADAWELSTEHLLCDSAFE